MVNKVILVGNLTKDVEYKHASTTIALLNLATNESWTDKQTGEKKTKAEFHRVVIFGVLADVCRVSTQRTGDRTCVGVARRIPVNYRVPSVGTCSVGRNSKGARFAVHAAADAVA